MKEVVIKPANRGKSIDLKELYRYRAMITGMIKKNIRIQFDERVLGYFWVFARPLTMVFIFTVIRKYSSADMKVPISYSLYFYSGIILWFYFREAIMNVAKSTTRDAGLIKKVYFPRIISPIVSVGSSFYNLLISMVPLVIMMIWQKVVPGVNLLLLPVILFQSMLLSMGIGMVFSSLSLIRKDYDNFLMLCLYVGLFVSPVIYSPAMIPESARIIYNLNPVSGSLLAFRSCLFSGYPFPLYEFLYSSLGSVIILMMGIRMHRRVDTFLADKL